MSFETEIVAALVGLFLGFIAFIGEDFVRRWLDKRTTRKKVLKDLISEAKENRAILEASTWVSLQKDAWLEAKSNGIVMDLKEEMRGKLVDLYSRITEKNELLVFHKIGVEKGAELGVRDGAGKLVTSLNEIIAQLSVNLKKQIDELIPMLEKEDC
jgi:DNA polymerase II small subunit/DNA polymerase delta subunit B